MSTTVSIYGTGSSSFGYQPERSEAELAWQAVSEALADAGIESVDAVFVGTVFGRSGVAQRCLHLMGITEVPVVTVENACASGTTAFHEAVTAVAAGRYRRVLALGIEHMTSKMKGAIQPDRDDVEGRAGMAMPALYAMAASRYLALGLATPRQLAMVAVKNHGNALHNPRAQHRGDYTVDEVLESRMIADPLTRLQCCSISDAAAAVVVGPARPQARDVRVRSSALRSGALWDHRSEHVWGFGIIRDTAHQALSAAGVEIADIDVLECHDAFTIGEIVTTEALGMGEIGQGGHLVETGHTALGGRQPVNPSGGLLARGHPLGATGCAQIHEITTQLRGEAGARQVAGARLGLVETMGGGTSGIDGNACVVTVLER